VIKNSWITLPEQHERYRDEAFTISDNDDLPSAEFKKIIYNLKKYQGILLLNGIQVEILGLKKINILPHFSVSTFFAGAKYATQIKKEPKIYVPRYKGHLSEIQRIRGQTSCDIILFSYPDNGLIKRLESEI